MKRIFSSFCLLFIVGGMSVFSFAQKAKKPTKKRPPQSAVILAHPDEAMPNCQPIEDLAIIKIRENGELTLGSNKVEKYNLTKELTNYICGKIPPEQIAHIEADSNLTFSNLVEIVKLGRKAMVSDFGLKVIGDTSTEVLVKVPMEDEEIPSTKKVKANPLALTVSVNPEGSLKLNNKPETLDTLKERLKQVFQIRKQKRIYIQGSKDVEKTVFVYADKSVKFSEIIGLLREIETVGAFPIGLDIDDYFLKQIFVK